MTMKFRFRVVSSLIVALKKIWMKKKLRLFKEMLVSWEGLLNTDMQMSTNSWNYDFYMFALLEIAPS